LTTLVLTSTELLKTKRMSIGTISHGRKKVAEGRWVPVKRAISKKDTTGLTYALKDAVRNKESVIANLDHEKCFVFDKAGKVVFEKTGKENRIEFSNEEMDKLQGTEIFTHNHPGGGSFSPEDIQFTWLRQIKEIRAVCTDYEYSAKITKEWKAGVWNAFVDRMSLIYGQVKVGFWREIDEGSITADQARIEHWHKVWSKMADVTPAFEYTREKRK